MSELRELLRREVEAITPETDWHGAVLRRSRRRGSLRRIQAAAIAVILGVGAVAVSVEAFGNRSRLVPAERRDDGNYVFSEVQMRDPSPPKGSISFGVAWSSDQWPGIHRCTWTAYGEGGRVVGEISHPYFHGEEDVPAGEAVQELPLEAPAKSASASCGSRIDVGTPYAYEFDVLDVTPEGEGESVNWTIAVDMKWLGGGYPGYVDCRVSITSGGERILAHESRFVREFDTISFVEEAPAHGGPYDASFDCRPHGTEEPFRPATRTAPPAPDEVVNGIGCYSEPSLEGSVTIVPTDGRSPIAVCAGFWEQGQVDTDVHVAPDLVACVPPTGETVWVFPGSGDLCRELDLHDLPAEYEQAALAFAEMQDTMIRRFPDPGPDCLSESEARQVAREVLDVHGYQDWAIEEGGGLAGEGFSETRPCAGLSFNASRKVLILVPEEI
jgi:hypothetical protein